MVRGRLWSALSAHCEIWTRVLISLFFSGRILFSRNAAARSVRRLHIEFRWLSCANNRSIASYPLMRLCAQPHIGNLRRPASIQQDRPCSSACHILLAEHQNTLITLRNHSWITTFGIKISSAVFESAPKQKSRNYDS